MLFVLDVMLSFKKNILKLEFLSAMLISASTIHFYYTLNKSDVELQTTWRSTEIDCQHLLSYLLSVSTLCLREAMHFYNFYIFIYRYFHASYVQCTHIHLFLRIHIFLFTQLYTYMYHI